MHPTADTLLLIFGNRSGRRVMPGVRLLRVMRAVKLSSVATLVLTLCVAPGCFNIAGDWRYEEIERVKSPDGIADAVLVRGGGGATTGLNFSVFLVPSGTKFDEKASWFERERALFSADHHEGLQLAWRKPKFLEIRFAKARISQFSNFWHSQEVQNYSYAVELRLVPLDENSSLSEKDKS
jgi:hypothetical protein